ncbi:MAG: prohibitin family protein [Bacteroidia bacterium]|nr:prohibitin family protein [Bacteroidia bacterium]
MKNKKVPVILGVAAFGLILVLIFSTSSFVTIDAGFTGVLFKKFGGGLDKEHVYGQGFHVVAPWNTMYIYDTRILEKTEEMDVLAKNGLTIHVDLSFRYKVIENEVGMLHDEIGTTYESKLIIPEIRSATRQVIGKYLPEELYSTKRDDIQTEIFENTDLGLSKKHIVIDAVLIRSVRLPQTIQTAIESKLKQEQEAAEYDFKLVKETKEAERKRIEAQGIKDFQEIVSNGLNDKLLKWQGIEATKELANSNNSKVVVIGSGKDGMPLILGNN